MSHPQSGGTPPTAGTAPEQAAPALPPMDPATAAQVLAEFRPDRHWRYAEMTRFLQACAVAYPQVCTLESLGTSPGGRAIWSLTLTNAATGPHREKPAYHIVANHHAGEVTGNSVALYTAHYLLTRYGQDPDVTRLLDTRAVYLLPRMTVDASDDYFDQPYMIRSSSLWYPYPEPQPGLHPEDVNGDGRILLMRFPDPLGEWKVSPRDPRLMVRRRPDDREGPFYRVLHEGLFKERGGALQERVRELKVAPNLRGYDFNRNYPLNWAPQHRQPGSGRYPADRPEVRALVEFYHQHPNICGAISYHTYSGMLLRPSPLVPDEQLDPTDLARFKYLGELCREMPGYPAVSVYHDFTFDYNPDELDVGSWLEWVYDGLGILGYEMELWDWPYIAGVPKVPFREQKEWTDAQREEHALKMLAWNDRELEGRGFIPWQPLDHPQLGPVEIGGWDPKWVVQNTPLHLLPEESDRCCRFTIQHALASPLLRVAAVEVNSLGGGLYKLAARVENQGWLPTQVTEVALKQKRLRGVTVEVTGARRVVAGRARQEIGELEGAGAVDRDIFYGFGHTAQSFRRVEWVIAGDPGATVTVSAWHPRAGRHAEEVRLP